MLPEFAIASRTGGRIETLRHERRTGVELPITIRVDPVVMLNGGAEFVVILGDKRKPKGSTRLPLILTRCRIS